MLSTKNKLSTILKLILVSLASITMITACSEFSNPVVSEESASSNESTFGEPVVEPVFGELYPAITAQMLREGPAPGYRFLDLSTALDHEYTTDSLMQVRLCEDDHSKTVKINNLVEVKVFDDCLSQDEIITIVAPLGNVVPVADFYPHPYQFNAPVQIKWKIKDLDLPDDFDFDSLVPLYIDDNGVAHELEYEWRNGHDELLVYTDHFSRYIVGQRISG